MAEIKKEEYEFERDVVKGAANPRTGKANAEKVSKYLEDKLRAKVAFSIHTAFNINVADIDLAFYPPWDGKMSTGDILAQNFKDF